MSNELRYNLDTSIINYTGRRCKQNDDRTLVLTLFDKAIPFGVAGATLVLKAQRSNSTFVIQDVSPTAIVGNIVTIQMSRDITRIAGQVKLELKITLASKDISTFTFMLEVEPSVISDGDIESTNVMTSLEELDTSLLLAGAENTNLNKAIDNGAYIRDDIAKVSSEANDMRLMLQDLINEANAINLTPIGSITMFAGDVIPNGWLRCNGQLVPKAIYPSLFNAIGNRYGNYTGIAFSVPNLNGRIPVGLDASQVEFETLGETGGTKTNILTESNMPAHTHVATAATTNMTCTASGDFTISATDTAGNTAIPDSNSYLAQPNKVGATTINTYNNNTAVTKEVQMPGGTVNVNGSVDGDITVTNESVGDGTPVNNIQPYIVLNYIIRAK